jgi:hypothetical protein
MTIELKPENDDNPQFIEIINKIISGFVLSGNLEHYVIIKINNWFDDKWAGFHGVFRDYSGPPDSGYVPGIAVTYHDTKALPPFARSRIKYLTMSGQPKENPASVFYFSGNSKSNNRGSLMASFPGPQENWEWYVGFNNTEQWKAIRYKSIGRTEIENIIKLSS